MVVGALLLCLIDAVVSLFSRTTKENGPDILQAKESCEALRNERINTGGYRIDLHGAQRLQSEELRMYGLILKARHLLVPGL